MLHLLKLFLKFFKIGLFTFGGGYAMIPLVHEVVDAGWISEAQFENMIGLSEVTPGPIALNMATYVGATSGGFLGGLFATLGVVLPSFIIICIVAKLLSKYSENKYIKSALRGTMCVAIGLIISITITMTLQVLTTFGSGEKLAINYEMIKTFVAVLVGYLIMWLAAHKKPNPIPTIFMSMLIGLAINLGVIQLLMAYAILILILIIKEKRA